jgi:hypothetical protein
MIEIPERYRKLTYQQLREVLEKRATPDDLLILETAPAVVKSSCVQCSTDQLAAKLRIYLAKTEAANVGKSQSEG